MELICPADTAAGPLSAAERRAFAPMPDGSRAARVLVIACGALARELTAVLASASFAHIDVVCLPAKLHNEPHRIAPAVRERIASVDGQYSRILCLYGDCGTGGELDRVMAETGATRIEGPHCYSFLLGEAAFDALMEQEPGTFFLTDYLVRFFDRLVIERLGLDRFPDLRADYFGNYRRLVYLAQTDDAELTRLAEQAAARLDLAFERRPTGIGAISRFLDAAPRGSGVAG